MSKRSLLTITTALILCGLAAVACSHKRPTSASPTPAPLGASATETPVASPDRARVVLTSGESKELLAPLSTTGDLKGVHPCPELLLSELKLGNINTMRKTAEGSIELEAGSETLVMLPGSASLEGVVGGAVGEETSLPLDEITEVAFEGGHPKEISHTDQT